VAYPPTLAISIVVQHGKGRAAHTVRREFAGAWPPSYFALSRGGAPMSIIKQYIDGQARRL
jgi:putative transposase